MFPFMQQVSGFAFDAASEADRLQANQNFFNNAFGTNGITAPVDYSSGTGARNIVDLAMGTTDQPSAPSNPQGGPSGDVWRRAIVSTMTVNPGLGQVAGAVGSVWGGASQFMTSAAIILIGLLLIVGAFFLASRN